MAALDAEALDAGSGKKRRGRRGFGGLQQGRRRSELEALAASGVELGHTALSPEERPRGGREEMSSWARGRLASPGRRTAHPLVSRARGQAASLEDGEQQVTFMASVPCPSSSRMGNSRVTLMASLPLASSERSRGFTPTRVRVEREDRGVSEESRGVA